VANARLIAIEKSRSGRGGTGLLLRMEDDLTFTLSDYVPEVDPAETGPSAITDRVLARLRVVYPEARTRAELNADPVVGGRVNAIRKALQRLEKRGLIRIADKTNAETGGKALHHYQAVLSSSRVEVYRESPIGQNPCGGTGFAMGQGGENEGVCPIAGEEFSTDSTDFSTDKRLAAENVGAPGPVDGTLPENVEGCPIAKPLQRRRSARNGTHTEPIRARPAESESRSAEELDRLRREAEGLWT
jgi:hypothetical protein